MLENESDRAAGEDSGIRGDEPVWATLLIRSASWPPSLAGFLVSTDAYMNLQLANTEEYIDGQFTGNLGEVLIR